MTYITLCSNLYYVNIQVQVAISDFSVKAVIRSSIIPNTFTCITLVAICTM